MSRFIHATRTALAVLVFLVVGCCHGLSKAPSLAPSLSVAPTFSPTVASSSTPSIAPTVSSAPSTVAPTFPPVEMGKFEWDLERHGDARFSFSEEFDTGEIMLDYNISLRDAGIQLFEVDCNTTVLPTVANAQGIVTQTSRRHANLTVSIDVVQANVTGSSIWSQNDDADEGLISMCIRVDLYNSQGTSVHFHEQIVRVSIGLLQGFQLGTVDLSRDEADETNGDADIDYELIACQCDGEDFECLSPTLTQGSQVFLCVMSLAAGVEILGIDSLSFSQGSYSIDSIVDGEVDSFTVVTVIDQKALIRNQMLSVFFQQYNPEDVIAVGLALLGFTDERGRRRLLRAHIKNRVLDNVMEEDDVAFRVPLSVQSSLADNSGAVEVGGTVMSLATILIGIAVLVA